MIARRIHWPNALTFLRVALIPPVVILTLVDTEVSSWIAFFAFGTAALTDGLDGYVARRMQLVSPTGQLLDPLADKMLVTAAIVALVVVDRLPPWAAAIIIAREVIVTALRLVASRRGRGFPASLAGKGKTGAQLVAILLYILPLGAGWDPLRNTFLGLALFLTVVSGLDYLVRAPRLLGAQRADRPS
ncbi:MAG: CDP-diacylglycerol--glycerol-3-phosphate 3-phosphatidyltransferase [Chloroflexi bacterium]|nr:CDP-diacylglycerol--glycerol-3-phosphate 3-phosphatidyltransferase [Chloroflexota bacterium]